MPDNKPTTKQICRKCGARTMLYDGDGLRLRRPALFCKSCNYQIKRLKEAWDEFLTLKHGDFFKYYNHSSRRFRDWRKAQPVNSYGNPVQIDRWKDLGRRHYGW